MNVCYSMFNGYDLGAFGLVHKGELKGVDGVVHPVAIKTIKCKVINSDIFVLFCELEIL